MSVTYDPTLRNDRDRVRFLCGDTDTATGKAALQDEEITWVLAEEANLYMAAATVCDVILRRQSGDGGAVDSFTAGELSISYRSVGELTELRDRLVARGRLHQVPFAGGISKSDIESREDDTDRARFPFKLGMHDYEAGQGPATPDDVDEDLS